MKTLLMVNGPPGAGKTSMCRILNKSINSVWLDGDWCWMMNPFIVNAENKKMVEDNIIHLLRNFLTNSSMETVIFSWVIPRDSIHNQIVERLKDLDFRLLKITLLCNAEALQQRMEKQGRPREKIENSVASLGQYWNMNTRKIDTTHLDKAYVSKRIEAMLTEKDPLL